MNDAARHPDDTTLFDLIDGALEDAARTNVERHLARCAACAAFVAAARVGTDAVAQNAITMPDDAADRMHLALADAWRARHAEAVALEDVADAALVSSDIVEVSFAPGDDRRDVNDTPSPRPTVQPVRRRRMRRLVPVLAFVVLAALAGTSIYLGDEQVGPSAVVDESSTSDVDAASSEADGVTADAGGPVSAGSGAEKAAPPELNDAGAPRGDVASPAAGGATGTSSSLADAAASADTGEGSIDQVLEPVCVATRDEAQIALPDGRPAQQILVGPLGIYLACG